MKMLKALLVPIVLFAANPLATAQEVSVQSLLESSLARLPGTELRVSRVMIPPHTSLAKHWHPGEEIAYLVSGSTTLWQQGKEDRRVVAGEAVMIPAEQVHTAITGEEGAEIIVFRVHKAGTPERTLVD